MSARIRKLLARVTTEPPPACIRNATVAVYDGGVLLISPKSIWWYPRFGSNCEGITGVWAGKWNTNVVPMVWALVQAKMVEPKEASDFLERIRKRAQVLEAEAQIARLKADAEKHGFALVKKHRCLGRRV